MVNMLNKKSKIFLIGFHTELSINIAQKLIERSIDIVYWTGRKKFFKKIVNSDVYKNIIFHDIFDIVRNIPAKGVDVANFEPITKNLIDKMLKCETVCWTMFDRYDNKEDLTLRQMKHIYYGYLKYWSGVLKKYKPDAIIFGTDVPHTVFNYIIYSLAKEYGIKTIMYKRTKGISPEKLVFFEDFKKYDDIKNAYENLKKIDFKKEDLSNEMQVYYHNQKDINHDSTPFYQKSSYMKTQSSNKNIYPSLMIILKNIKQLTFFTTCISYIKMYTRKKQIFGFGEKITISFFEKKKKQKISNKKIEKYRKNYFDLISETVDFTKKYIYIPLHYQPEASTLPLGDVYDDQILMIENISKAIPDDWVIYVKENTIQWKRSNGDLGRYYDYYQQILLNKNVQLISTEISSFELFKSCSAVATVTGTAAWEGIMRGKPALIFGYTWFMNCEGVFFVDSYKDCKKVIDNIINGYEINEGNIIKYLGAVEKVSVKGYAHNRFRPASDIDENENIKNITEKIVERLNI
jgi:hypothetical protein